MEENAVHQFVACLGNWAEGHWAIGRLGHAGPKGSTRDLAMLRPALAAAECRCSAAAAVVNLFFKAKE
jgi:hypothetical protein